MINLPELSENLRTLPSRIAFASAEVEKARFAWDSAVAEYEHQKAKLRLEIQVQAEKITIPDLDARVTADEKIFKLKMECIKTKSTYKRKELIRQELEDLFVSLRKIGELNKTELRTLGG